MRLLPFSDKISANCNNCNFLRVCTVKNQPRIITAASLTIVSPSTNRGTSGTDRRTMNQSTSVSGHGSAGMPPSPLLAMLPEHLQQQLAQLPLLELAAGTPVFERNARCGGFPLLLSGTV